MNIKRRVVSLIRPKGNGPKVNQHAPVYEHRATRRNRSRAEKNRKAIDESREE